MTTPGSEILSGDFAGLLTKILTSDVQITDFICRADNGIWEAGSLSIIADQNQATATFADDGSADLAIDTDTWTLPPYWQANLNPL